MIVLKTLYRLPEDLLKTYESFLIRNHFTEFYELEEGAPADSPGLTSGCRSSAAYIRFFRE